MDKIKNALTKKGPKHNKMDPKNYNKGLIIIVGVLLKFLGSFHAPWKKSCGHDC